MKIKDIVNREIVNLTNCEHEPIHIPGSIQPHGFLIAVDAATFEILFCSENVNEYIQLSVSDILSKKAEAIFGPHIFDLFSEVPLESSISSHPYLLEIQSQKFSVLLHRSGKNIILEAEPHDQTPEPLADIYDQTSRFLSYMHQTSTLKELCDMVSREIRQITGYDRVMIYRFDEDYNGEVYAEAVRDDLEPFLGLHYPHTDIPVQARELYLKNLLRLIYDINYESVPIYTAEENSETKLDLSHSILRSTSPIHVQYLQNMGVGATLTISLVHNGKLWGLVACHHYSPKKLSHKVRLAAQLQGHFITSQIDVRQLNEEYEISKVVNTALENLSAIPLTNVESDFNKVIASPDLLALCAAAGAVIVYNQEIYKTGLVPNDDDISLLAEILSKHSENGSYSTETLTPLIPDRKSLCKTVSGVVYHELTPEIHNCIMWFRPESISEIKWAGDPEKAILKDEKGLSPRNSFELYKQTVQCISKRWLQPELTAAANFAHILQKHANFLILSNEEAKLRRLSEVLRETNLELENINWISTHDLQEPLRKMQLVSSKMLAKESNLPDDVVSSLHRINNSASRMQNLLTDILAYTRINQEVDISQSINLNQLVTKVLKKLHVEILQTKTIIRVDALPRITGSTVLIEQAFSHLISNSIKFRREDIVPSITITAEVINIFDAKTSRDQRYISIVFTDNGLGFNSEFANSIFNVFTKAHSSEQYDGSGSGIGLAICKKIISIHGGFITADAVANQGARFKVHFPLVE